MMMNVHRELYVFCTFWLVLVVLIGDERVIVNHDEGKRGCAHDGRVSIEPIASRRGGDGDKTSRLKIEIPSMHHVQFAAEYTDG